MDCRILRQLTLTADGHLTCDDSNGYSIKLGHVTSSPGWNIKHTTTGAIYQHIRASFARGAVPWPGTCETCDCLAPGSAPLDTLDRSIRLMVEPTLACNISCPCCRRRQVISRGRSLTDLDPAVLGSLCRSCRDNGIDIEHVHYLGWGEPLLHGDFQGLAEAVRKNAPDTAQEVTTAGNVVFKEQVGSAPLDRIVVSCDGARQSSYELYRREGRFSLVRAFMVDSKIFGSPTTFVEWKYILFEHNDSDEELIEAQKLAESIGIDSILFVVTNSKWKSNRFAAGDFSSFPLISPLATLSPAAALDTTLADAVFTRYERPESGALIELDRCRVNAGGFLVAEGWALLASGGYVRAVLLDVDGERRARSRTQHRRIDVSRTYAHAVGPMSGFLFRIPLLTRSLPGAVRIGVETEDGAPALQATLRWSDPTVRLKERPDFPDLRFFAPTEVPADDVALPSAVAAT